MEFQSSTDKEFQDLQCENERLRTQLEETKTMLGKKDQDMTDLENELVMSRPNSELMRLEQTVAEQSQIMEEQNQMLEELKSKLSGTVGSKKGGDMDNEITNIIEQINSHLNASGKVSNLSMNDSQKTEKFRLDLDSFLK